MKAKVDDQTEVPRDGATDRSHFARYLLRPKADHVIVPPFVEVVSAVSFKTKGVSSFIICNKTLSEYREIERDHSFAVHYIG